jgi:hypothetical protein
MSKDFFKMSAAERDAKAKTWEREFSLDETRPMSKRSQALWKLAKRGRGRPRKAAGERAKRVLISLDPTVIAMADAFASSQGLDRSRLFAISVKAFIEATKASGAEETGDAAIKKPRADRGKRVAK